MSIVSINQSLNRKAGVPEGITVSREQQLQAAAEQFEALFLQQILKQMRKASDVLAEGNPMRSRELDTLRDFYDEALAEHLAGQKQTGIADLLVAQLSGASAQGMSADEAALAARSAELPARQSVSALGSLRSTWQRGVEGLSQLVDNTSAGFVALVDRVVQQESGGRVDAVSPKGARGLMQLMPGTAQDMAAELGLAYDDERLTTDADYNRRLGSAYLNKMLERYDGHQALALAAYNAGPGRVDEWLMSNGDPRLGEISTGAWIERIPYEETRNYARSILGDLAQAPAPATTPPLSATARQQLASSLSADSGMQSVSKLAGPFKSADDFVASTASVAEPAAPNGVVIGLAAFAQPMRFERQEK